MGTFFLSLGAWKLVVIVTKCQLLVQFATLLDISNGIIMNWTQLVLKIFKMRVEDHLNPHLPIFLSCFGFVLLLQSFFFFFFILQMRSRLQNVNEPTTDLECLRVYMVKILLNIAAIWAIHIPFFS